MTPHRILILERDADFVGQCRRALEAMGHETEAVEKPAQALTRAAAWRPTLVLAAVRGLKDVEGFTTQAREHDPAAQIVLISDSEEDLTKLEAAGADHLLCRPVTDSALVALLRSALRYRDLQRRLQQVIEERDQLRGQVEKGALGDEARERYYQFEFFKKIVGIELKRSRRYDFPLALMLVRWDQAEPVPEAGEIHPVFAALAKVTRDGLRDIDIPITFSEETILVMMPHTDMPGARVVADRIRTNGAQIKPKGDATSPTVTVAIVSAEGASRLDFGALMQAATRALEEAHRAGGDQVVEA
jgi:PleD family two-component response regulator